MRPVEKEFARPGDVDIAHQVLGDGPRDLAMSLTVHIGARVAALAGASEVLVTDTVNALVIGSGITFADRGVHALKGVADPWRIFYVESA
jgi:class 3 adenylate cyclase